MMMTTLPGAAGIAVSLLLLIWSFAADGQNPSPSPRKRPSSPTKFLRPATRLVVEMPTMKACPDVQDNAIRFTNMTVGMVGKSDFVLDGAYEVLRDVPDISETQIAFTKCREHSSANTCEHFQTWRFNKDVCHLMYQPNSIWSSFHKYVTPTPTCPPKMGKYLIRNATLDMKAMQALPLPLEGNVWFVKFTQLDPNRKVHTCTDTEMRFHRAREN